MYEPFEIFPEEIWEVILDKLEDSRDIQNVLACHSKLDETFHKNKPKWLMDQVLTVLLDRDNDSKMELVVRQVCSRWSRVVSASIEYQYNPEDLDLPAITRGIGHIFGTSFLLNHSRFQYHYFYGADCFEKFHNEMKNCPLNRNPFVSRSISIAYHPEGIVIAEKNRAFWSAVLKFLRKYGRHIWFIDIKADYIGPSVMAYWKILQECLGYLPNLKGLILGGRVEPTEEEIDMDAVVEENRPFPDLPNLEAISLLAADLPYDFLLQLLRRYSSQIRKLGFLMVPSSFVTYDPSFCDLFPNLTDLHFFSIDDLDCLEYLRKYLDKLNAPLLSRLRISCLQRPEWSEQSLSYSIESDLFQWLKRFPGLKLLDFSDKQAVFKESGLLSPEIDSSNLEFLKITDSYALNYDFLLCLPALQHLQITTTSKPMVIDYSGGSRVRIREEIMTAKLYNSNIWDLLKKLKTVTITVIEGPATDAIINFKTFHRLTYDNHFKGKGKRDTQSYPLRDDILNFLEELD